jgi:hypothetical protein
LVQTCVVQKSAWFVIAQRHFTGFYPSLAGEGWFWGTRAT